MEARESKQSSVLSFVKRVKIFSISIKVILYENIVKTIIIYLRQAVLGNNKNVKQEGWRHG